MFLRHDFLWPYIHVANSGFNSVLIKSSECSRGHKITDVYLQTILRIHKKVPSEIIKHDCVFTVIFLKFSPNNTKWFGLQEIKVDL